MPCSPLGVCAWRQLLIIRDWIFIMPLLLKSGLEGQVLLMPAQLQKTTLAKKESVSPVWFICDARDQILGRLAVRIAMILMGKHKPGYTPNVDTGDFVVVTNCEKIRLTGKKTQTKEYDHYTYHVGGRKVVPYRTLAQKRPEEVFVQAVRRMLPKNKLGRHMLTKLKVYRGSDHPHAAQKPQPCPGN